MHSLRYSSPLTHNRRLTCVLSKWALISALALIVGLKFGVPFVVWVSEQEGIVQAAFIASIGAPVTAFTHFLGQRVENKNQIEATFREKKIELYLKFVTHLDSFFHPEQGGNRSTKQTVKILLDFQRRAVVLVRAGDDATIPDIQEGADSP